MDAVVGSSTDEVTRLRERLNELLAANERLEKEVAERLNFRLTVDSIPGMVHTMTATGQVEFVNRQILDFFGKALEELDNWETLVHPDDRSRVVERWTRSVMTGEPFDSENRVLCADGAYRWLHTRGLPLRDINGNIVRWYNLLTDIDERKRAEEALRESERESRLIVDTIPGLVAILTAAGEVAVVNQQLVEYCGQTLEAMQRWGTNGTIHAEDLPGVVRVFTGAITSGQPYDFEARIRRFDGVYRWFQVRGLPLRDASEHIIRWYVLLIDIDDRKRASDALRELQITMSRAAQIATLGELAASIAHEVNQPLSGIITNAGTCLRMLATDPPDIDGARETARRTIRDGNRAADVIARLRALFSKKEFTLEPVDLNEATREVIALSLNDLQRDRILIQSELADDLPVITGDRIQLQQVVLNLLRNASDAMRGVDERPRRLLIRTERENVDRVRVTVRDAGAGLEGQSMDKVFDAFYTTKSGGMGIGLSVSRSIVERHHGRLWAEANDGPGTTFSFSIPIAP